MHVYRDIETHAPDYQPMEFYSSDGEEQQLAEWLAGRTEFSPRADGEVLTPDFGAEPTGS